LVDSVLEVLHLLIYLQCSGSFFTQQHNSFDDDDDSNNNEKVPRETQTLHAGCSKAEQKNLPHHRPLPLGRGMAKI